MRLLIANRAEIACRIIRTAKKLGLHTISIYTQPDADLPHRYNADESIYVESYSNAECVLDAIKKTEANLVHPGYGFLSEQSSFVALLEKSNVKFVGPSSRAIDAVGDKAKALELATSLKIPTARGIRLPELNKENYEPIIKAVKEYAKDNPYPLLLKARAGGGGRGMRPINSDKEIDAAVQSASREALLSFNDSSLVVERKITNARHIEVQILGDQHGNVKAIGDRDCSLQRNHQKVIEEAPAPNLTKEIRQKLHTYAEQLLKAASYSNAGTVEFLLNDKNEIFFLEVNPRLQVEHPVTELTSGFDLVEMQIKIANGEKLPDLVKQLEKSNPKYAHAVEARICAEEYFPEYRIATGAIRALTLPEHEAVRTDFGYQVGNRVTHLYDSMIGKLITFADSREAALMALRNELLNLSIFGVKTSIPELIQALDSRKEDVLWKIDQPFNNFIRARTKEESLSLALAWCIANYLAIEKQNDFAEQSFFRLGGVQEFENDLHLGKERAHVKLTVSGEHKIFSAELGELKQKFILEGPYSVEKKEDSVFIFHCSSIQDIAIQHLDIGSWVQHNGLTELIKLDLKKNSRAADGGQQGLTEIRSHLPGKLLKVLVKVGDTVEPESILMILESMKMENQIKAGTTGKVKQVLCQAGDVVQVDQVLLELE